MRELIDIAREATAALVRAVGPDEACRRMGIASLDEHQKLTDEYEWLAR